MQIKMTKGKIVLAVLALELLLVMSTSMVDLSPKIDVGENISTALAVKRSFPLKFAQSEN